MDAGTEVKDHVADIREVKSLKSEWLRMWVFEGEVQREEIRKGGREGERRKKQRGQNPFKDDTTLRCILHTDLTKRQSFFSSQASDRYGSVSHKSLAKFVMLFGVVFFLLYSNYRKESVQCIAKVTETLEKTRSVSMLCSPAYKAEIQALDPVCLPARCGRMISDTIVTEGEAHALLNLAKKGLAQGIVQYTTIDSFQSS